MREWHPSLTDGFPGWIEVRMPYALSHFGWVLRLDAELPTLLEPSQHFEDVTTYGKGFTLCGRLGLERKESLHYRGCMQDAWDILLDLQDVGEEGMDSCGTT